MTTSQPVSGISVYTTTTGTGNLSITTAVPGFADFNSSDTGLPRHYAIYQGGVSFETGVGTYNHAARTFSRDTVFNNINRTGTAYSFGSGTKELSIVLTAERVAMLDVQGRWLEPQYYGGKRQYMDTDEDSWHDCEIDDVWRWHLNATQVYQITGGLGQSILIGTDNGTAEGPERTLRRDSATPAANDAGPVDRDQMRDVNGALVSTYKRGSRLLSAAAGAHSSSVTYEHWKAGVQQPAFVHRPDFVSVQAGMSVVTAAKTALNAGQVGAELRPTGEAVGVVDANPGVLAYRNISDGRVLEVGRAGAAMGGLTSIAGTVAIDPFTGMHWSDWAPGQGGPEFEELGTVVSTAEGFLDIPNEPAVLVRPSLGPGDRRVYGVCAGRVVVKFGIEDRALLGIFAVGNGWIKVKGAVTGGDFLCASTTPGVAEAAPTGTTATFGNMGCLVAKATQNSPDDGGVRLVACVYWAG